MNTLIWSYVPYSDHFHCDWEQQHYGDHDDPAVMTVVGLFRVKLKKVSAGLICSGTSSQQQDRSNLAFLITVVTLTTSLPIWMFSSRSSLSPHLCPFGFSHNDCQSHHIFAHLLHPILARKPRARPRQRLAQLL